MADVFNGATTTGSSFNYTEGDIRYVNEEDFTKAAIDALNVDADTLDGLDSAAFEKVANKNQFSGYAGLNSTGVVADAQVASISGVAGSYTNSNITVDGKGRVTVAANGTGGGGGGGADGINAFTITTAGFTQPSTSTNVTVSVDETSWMATGQTLYMETGGYYTVASVPGPTSVVLTNTGYPGNAAGGASITTGKTLSPAGLRGATGTSGGGGGGGGGSASFASMSKLCGC